MDLFGPVRQLGATVANAAEVIRYGGLLTGELPPGASWAKNWRATMSRECEIEAAVSWGSSRSTQWQPPVSGH